MKGNFIIALFILGTTGPNGFAQDGRPERCRVTADSSRRVELADGRIVSTDVQSAAVSDGAILAVGRNAYVFPRGSLPVSSPIMRDSIIGFLVDRRGRVSVVPAPLGNRHAYFPLVAAGERGAFHVLFVTGGDSLDRVSSSIDSATIWYAQYANGRWSRIRPVLPVRAGMLQTEFTSGLVDHDGSPSFLFAFGSDDKHGSGIARLRLSADRWLSDTLWTPNLATIVRAASDAKGSLAVLFAMQPFRTKEAEQLYISRFDSGWSTPRHIGGSATQAVSGLALIRRGEGLLASWSQWSWPNASTNVVFVSRLDDRIAALRPLPLDSGATTYPWAMLIADGRPAWFHVGMPYGQAMSLTIAESGGDMTHHTLNIPLHNPRPWPVALSSQRFVVLTMKRGRTSGESMIASYMTGLTIRCPTSGRR